MKKFFMFLAVAGALTFTASVASAQDQPAPTEQATQLSAEDLLKGTGEDVPFHQQIKSYFIQGGPAIERILYLSFAKTNTKKLIAKVEDALAEGGVQKALDVCRDTKGPVASIFYDGLLHYDEGLDVVEKRIASAGGVQMSLMENNLSWISLFIAIAPSLGFLGTVIGMVKAFDAIEAAGDISPNIVAGGMKVALITTVGGLIVAMILQVFYNYILSRIDALSIDMEEASINLVDALAKYEQKK